MLKLVDMYAISDIFLQISDISDILDIFLAVCAKCWN